MRFPRLAVFVLLLGVLASLSAQAASDPAAIEANIKERLVDFLTYNSDPARHEGFWAEDLIYTSSAAAVRTKPMIMESTRAAAAKADPSQPAAKYSAEDVKVRVYDGFAALTFELVARYPDARVLRYRNSGTFVLRNGRWQAVTWQATAIPPPAK
ncbi:MAG TPA: nuclear transport factor 2 family protein [Opitutaceae bacterium]